MAIASNATNKGFIASLYDFSFNSFVTTKLLKVLYILVTVLYSVLALIFLLAGLVRGGVGILALILVPIVYFLSLGMARVSFEVIMIIFRIGEYARDIRDQGLAAAASTRGTPPAAGPGTWTPGAGAGGSPATPTP